MRRAALLSGATLLLALGVALTLLPPAPAGDRALEASGARIDACAHMRARDLDAQVRLGCARGSAPPADGAPVLPLPEEDDPPHGAPFPPTPPREPAPDAPEGDGDDGDEAARDGDDEPGAPWPDGAGGCGCGSGVDEDAPAEGAAGGAGATTGRPDAPRAPPGPGAPDACARECVGGGPRAVEAAADAARDAAGARGLLGRLLDALVAWLGLPPLPT